MNYPNLNHSVYSERRLKALRIKNEIDVVLNMKGISLQPEQIEILFIETGGIGRQMDSWLAGTYTATAIPNILQYYESETQFRSVVNMLYVNFVKILGQFPWSSIGIKFSETRTLDIQLQTLRRWEDLGLLYYDSNRFQYELLFPCHMNVLKMYLDDSSTNGMQYVALETTLRGWEGYGSAGQVLESFILQRMVLRRITPFDELEWTYCEKKLSFSPQSKDDDSTMALRNCTLESLVGKVFGMKKDSGVDAVQFQRHLDINCIDVTLTQIKTGEISKKISKGNDRSRDASTYFMVIQHKAELGWMNLKKELMKTFAGVEFKLSRLVLITNKSIELEVQDIKEVRIDNTSIPLELFGKEDFEEAFKDDLLRCNLLTGNKYQ